MAFCITGQGYDVYALFNMKVRNCQPGGWRWVLRSNGHAQTDIEMAQALGQDLKRNGVGYQIRRGEKVVEEWVPDGIESVTDVKTRAR